MNHRLLLSLSLSALVLGGTTVGCSATSGGVASAGTRDVRAGAGQASAEAARAERALAKGKPDEAVSFAESAAALAPRDADYRVLLGQSYLKAGRFASARQAFSDALTLSPDDAKAALNLALVQIGLGDWATARAGLDQHARVIPAADRGLAMALAGDPAAAVELLAQAARSPGADVKTRQNLALALALDGRWPEAKAVAAMDLSPADVDGRLEQWAAFARPSSASDQVAALLGVRPVQDAGQPIALALVAPVPVAPAAPEPVKAAQAAPAETPAPVQAAAPVEAPAAVAAVAPEPPRVAASIPMGQPLPAAPAAEPVTAHRVAAARPVVAAAKGDWYVQFGAFENAGVAREGWARAVRRQPSLRAQTPDGMAFQSKAGQVYRLSVGGFGRADAAALCRSFRARGGNCFVRTGAGDQVAQWVKKGEQLASR